MSEPRIAVILPAFNEELTIAATIQEFHRYLPHAEIWVINNRSTDQTESLAKEALSNLGQRGGIIREGRPGKANAVRRAFLDIDANVYILADADLTYPARQVNDLICPILKNDADMVVGDRHSGGQYAAENKRRLHGFGNVLIRWLVNKLFHANLTDVMSGYRALSRAFAKTYPILVEGFEIETDMTLHALDKRFRIMEVPIDYRDRPEGSESKLSTIRDGLRVIKTITTILRYYRPMLFFGGASLIFMFFGLIAGIPVLHDWITERYIYHVPLAILATGLEVIAVVLAAVGLILDSISHNEKSRFERLLLGLRSNER